MRARVTQRARLRFVALIALVGAALAADDNGVSSPTQSPGPPADGAEFHFVRLVYTGTELRFGGRPRWMTDWPEAETHLLGGVRRLTRIATAPEGQYLSILDDTVFDHPWLYAVEVGSWSLSDAEAARLRDYLLRGGFLMVDDFHGTREWAVFTQSMHKVFPDRAIVDIPLDDAVFHVAYDLEDHEQIPGIQSLYSGRNYERDGYTPYWRGIYDDEGRLMVVINFNMDLGDAWEHADTPEYALRYTTRAYQYAINYILYAMTH
jgi:Domain of unknown function (DUF4159)